MKHEGEFIYRLILMKVYRTKEIEELNGQHLSRKVMPTMRYDQLCYFR